MDKPSRKLLPGYEPSEASPSSSSASPSSNANPPLLTSKSATGTAAAAASSSSSTTTTSSARRQVTSLACNECRRVKCKCDGERPTCGFCERKGLVCDYDVGPRGRTALMALRHQYSLLETENSQLRELLKLIATLPPADASEVLGRLRTNEDPLRVLQMVQAARLLMAESSLPAGAAASAEGHLGVATATAATTPAPIPTNPQLHGPTNAIPIPGTPLARHQIDEKPSQSSEPRSTRGQSELKRILNTPEE